MRFAANVGFVERPIVISLIWSYLWGVNLTVCLFIGLFFELFWLDLSFVGTFVPPHFTLATCLSLFLVSFFHTDNLNLIVLILTLASLCAYGGSWLEKKLRTMLLVNYLDLERLFSEQGKGQSLNLSKLVGKRILAQFGLDLVTFNLLGLILTWIVFKFRSLLLGFHNLSWHLLLFVACLGAVLSLRYKRLYLVLIVIWIVVGGVFYVLKMF